MPRPPPVPNQAERDPYMVETVWRACDVLEAFRSPEELLRLSEVAARSGLSRPTAFRLLYTLERRGLLERMGRHQYRLRIRPLRPTKYRLGYAGESAEFAFSREVTESVLRAAGQEGLDLLVLDNRYSAKTALRNAEIMIREKVDLALEFQVDEHFAPVISSRFLEARIPIIAIEIPHPGATYYGADNYGAGLIGGRHLGRWARRNWSGKVDELVLLILGKAGPLPNSRLTGILAGVRECLPDFRESNVTRLDGDGRFGVSLEVMRKHLRRSRAERLLVGAINDPSALGALRALEESGRAPGCAVLGQNAALEARIEMRRPASRMIGSVGFFPERYGEGLIRLALDILQNQPVPPAVFVRHQLVTPSTVDHLYPNDALLAPPPAVHSVK